MKTTLGLLLLILLLPFITGCGSGDPRHRSELELWKKYDAANTNEERYGVLFALTATGQPYMNPEDELFNPDGKPPTHPKTGESASDLLEKVEESMETRRLINQLKKDNERNRRLLGE